MIFFLKISGLYRQRFGSLHFLVILYALASVFTIDVGVRLYLNEVLVAFLIYFLLPGFLKNWNIHKKLIIFSYLMLMVAIIISDVVNEVDFSLFVRNLSNPLIGVMCFVFLCALFERQKNLVFTYLFFLFLFKLIFGEPLYGEKFSNVSYWQFIESLDGNIFKVKVEPWLSPLVVVLSASLATKRFNVAMSILLVVGVAYMAIGARSAGLIFLASACFLFLLNSIHIRKVGITFSLPIIVFIFYLFYIAYVYYVISFGESDQSYTQLMLMDNAYNPFELILIGRSEWLVMPQAIIEKPLFGWGSWAEDKNLSYLYLRSEILGVDDLGMLDAITTKQIIPAHSVIGAAWLWSGILGFASMMILTRVLFKLAANIRYLDGRFSVIASFALLFIVWHLFFSPPQAIRVLIPSVLAVLVVSVLQVDRIGKSSNNPQN